MSAAQARPKEKRGGIKSAGVLAWLRLARVFNKLERLSQEDLRTHDLSGAQFDVLAQVGVRDGCTQQELADALLVTKGNVCQLLDKMEGRGLIVRRQEGRINRLSLTEDGRRLFEEVVPAHEAVIADRFSVLSEGEQTRLYELLRELDRALDRDAD